jgi:hypothetical protein
MSANASACLQFNLTTAPAGQYRLPDGSLKSYAERGIQVCGTDDKPSGNFLSIPLSNSGETATVCAEDFQSIILEHGDAPWLLNSNGSGRYAYVRMWSSSLRNIFSVARAVIGDNRRAVARYRNGDRTDLRRENVWPESRKKHIARVTGATAGANRNAEAEA